MGSNLNTCLKWSMSISDKQIDPILLYGSAIWGAPSFNTSVKVYGINEKKDVKENLQNIFKCVGVDDMSFVSYRYNTKNMCTYVVLNDIIDKFRLLEAYNKYPCTVKIESVSNEDCSASDKLYNKYVKSTLGVSKYTSTTLCLGELGRFPIKFKAITSSVLFWHRMATGSCNPLLNEAYECLKEENSVWLNNIKYFLLYNGLGNIWESPYSYPKEFVKTSVLSRLKDCHVQRYHAYINDDDNYEKCEISRVCINGDYKMKNYLQCIKSPEIKSIFSRLRLDANMTKDCKYRSFRFKNVTDKSCDLCKVPQSVIHCLFECKQKNIEESRNMFMEKYTLIVNNFQQLSIYEKLSQILCLKPNCNDDVQEKAVGIICAYVKSIYKSIDNP